MGTTTSTRSAYRRWWLGDCAGDIAHFSKEMFSETHKGLGLLLALGAGFFLVRGLIEIAFRGTLGWQGDLLFRVVGALVFGYLWLSYRKSKNDRVRGFIFAVYLLLYMSATMWWSTTHGMHIGYLAAPLVLCLVMGVILWPLIGGLYWPAMAVVAPAACMLVLVNARVHDWVIYGLCFTIAGIFALIIRRTRLRSTFRLFCYREQLQVQVESDPLTGLYNLTGWRARAESLVQSTQLSGQPLSIVFFDIDHFKRVNDTHGHAAGDDVLICVAKALSAVMRGGDVLARLGGEEFVAALPGADLDQARVVAERALERVRGVDGCIGVTISAGIAQLNAQTNLIQAIAQADRGLLLAKHMGRNQVQYSEKMV
jgi:diguanylate cyclase (GGDEF)-like protein